MTTYVIDPPSGWKYGFPKACPKEVYMAGEEAIKAWLIEEGYPPGPTKEDWFYWRTLFFKDRE